MFPLFQFTCSHTIELLFSEINWNCALNSEPLIDCSRTSFETLRWGAAQTLFFLLLCLLLPIDSISYLINLIWLPTLILLLHLLLWCVSNLLVPVALLTVLPKALLTCPTLASNWDLLLIDDQTATVFAAHCGRLSGTRRIKSEPNGLLVQVCCNTSLVITEPFWWLICLVPCLLL